MNTPHIAFAFAALFAMATSSCTTTSSPVVPTSRDNDLHGYVELWDSCGGQDPDLASVIVTATSSIWSGADTTGTDGTWSIVDAPAGVYTISAVRGNYVAPPIENLQYVGVGKYDVKEVSLAAAVPIDYVSSATIDSVFWGYETETLENGQTVRVDSTYVIKVNVLTKCVRTSPLDYRITESPDADCQSFIVAGVSTVEYNGSSQTVNLGGAYKRLVQHYGSGLAGKHLYLQIRYKQLGKRADGTVGCLEPIVVDLFY
ncbi:hypothetical protein BH10BAC6_BH10BAC6_02320 [soil metagenome]